MSVNTATKKIVKKALAAVDDAGEAIELGDYAGARLKLIESLELVMRLIERDESPPVGGGRGN